MFHLRFLSNVKTAEFELRHRYADVKIGTRASLRLLFNLISMALEAVAFGRTISRAFREFAHDADGSTVSPVFAHESSVASDGLHAHSLQLADLWRVPPRIRQWSCHLRARLFDWASDELSFRCLRRFSDGSGQRANSAGRVRRVVLRRRFLETGSFEGRPIGL